MIYDFAFALPMSLIGARTAVVSLGVSCQTARQIRRNQALLSTRLGDALQPLSLPLDWMFVPPDAMARLLRSAIRVPPQRGELIAAEQPFWARHGIWLWHDPVANDADFTALQARQTRRWVRFDALGALDRRVFVVSNTQNNLNAVARKAPQRLDFRLTRQRMTAIAEALAHIFPRGRNDLLFVAYAARLGPDAAQAGFPLVVLDPDKTDHEGDDRQWTAAFTARLAA